MGSILPLRMAKRAELERASSVVLVTSVSGGRFVNRISSTRPPGNSQSLSDFMDRSEPLAQFQFRDHYVMRGLSPTPGQSQDVSSP